MEIFNKGFIVIVMLLIACKQEPDVLPDFNGALEEKKTQMAQTWRYKDVIINNSSVSTTTFNSVMEPASFTSRTIISKRKIKYDKHGGYQLQWDNRGEYSLGTKGDENWQPDTGYWTIKGDSLIHNQGQAFETHYELEVGQYSMTREHLRYMSNWDNYVLFTERFVSEEQFLAGGKNDVPQDFTSFSNEKGTFTLNWKRPDVSDLNGFNLVIFEVGNPDKPLYETDGKFPAKDNAVFYGINNQLDLEVQIWSRFDNGNISDKVNLILSTNPVPSKPENLEATSLVHSILLEWDIPKSNVIEGFKLVYEPNGADTLAIGKSNALLIEELDPGSTYTFNLYSYDRNNCLSDVAFVSATPLAPGAGNLPYTETFNLCSNNWISVSDGERNWICTSSNDFPLHGNAFGIQNAANTSELWLISPVIDPGVKSPVLSFEYLSFLTDQPGYGLEVRILDNYNGSGIPKDRGYVLETGIDNDLNTPEFELSDYTPIPENKPFRIAFLSTNSANNTTIISAVDNIRVEYEVVYELPYLENFNKEYIVELNNWSRFSYGNVEDHWRNRGIGASGASGDIAALMHSYNSDENEDTRGDDWLITPTIDLGTSADPSLSFDYASNFNDADPTKGVHVLLSTDYEQWSDPTLSSWIELDFIDHPTNPDNVTTPIYRSKAYSLSGYSGNIHLAFHYTSSGTGKDNSMLIRIDNVEVK